MRAPCAPPRASDPEVVVITPKKPSEKTVIGWSECVDFPLWDLYGVRAKCDTGARTSALHVEEFDLLPGGQVHFEIILSRKNPNKRARVTAPISRWGRVRSSTGEFKVRCFVKTLVTIGHVTKEIEISLVSREKMRFRMLLGRSALERDFLVDVSHRGVLHPKKDVKPKPKLGRKRSIKKP